MVLLIYCNIAMHYMKLPNATSDNMAHIFINYFYFKFRNEQILIKSSKAFRCVVKVPKSFIINITRKDICWGILPYNLFRTGK